MKQLLLISIASLLLSSCVFIHRMDIEQGNVITPSMVNKLHNGMSMTQVKEIMGTPVLMNTFSDERVDYIYTLKKGGNRMTEKKLILTFNRRGILENITQG